MTTLKNLKSKRDRLYKQYIKVSKQIQKQTIIGWKVVFPFGAEPREVLFPVSQGVRTAKRSANALALEVRGYVKEIHRR